MATQALANATYGPRGLELMSRGKTASEDIELLKEEDEQKAQRQMGIVDARGNAAAFTDENCHDWAGSLTEEHYAIQGNILAGRQVVEAMAGAYEASDDDLAGRLLAALEAGQEAGGDPRESSRRHSSWFERAVGTGVITTASWICAWTTPPTR